MLRSAALILALTAAPLQAAPVTVFAAASLRTALDQIAGEWQDETGETANISYAGSSVLAQQIIQGAPADVFISASTDWMDAAADAGAIEDGTRHDLLGNSLVLVAPQGTKQLPVTDLPQALGDERLAMALVDSVPAGVYGKEALTHLGLWGTLRPHVAQADNVRAALALVATGEAPFGIVYASDAVAEPRVSVVASFPDDSHDPITYPAAQVKGSEGLEAAAFLAFLSGDEAARIFAAQGFRVLN
ncbi:molybdate ABC transporter substrate-binding protein [Falsirhodobacter algicola]|uniref:Molybdate ABC transporter substrate-binding protein n=1 Tax=Falsirhodobacter algicola TaxID=2692330 RepID=A0A8J8MRC3_9RHOB|nr:molybdate ABC transporter substrate-binding protein [Falsirhodobacter algicola]QUS35342.1 molybdate ABC transporter substrate-binding protein [Falsirhodobacter algicola]